MISVLRSMFRFATFPFKHALNVTCFVSLFSLFLYVTGFFDSLFDDGNTTTFDDEDTTAYPFDFSLIWFGLTLLKLFGLTNLPISLGNLSGFMFYNISPPSETNPKPKRSHLLDPFICIRIVTRGNYPELVRANAVRNMSLCLEYGLDRFVVEVVTDRDIGLPRLPKVRQIVVPEHFKTKRGTLFKARALQYAIEYDREFMSDEDWIVHLDEETALTKSSLTGKRRFIESISLYFFDFFFTAP